MSHDPPPPPPRPALAPPFSRPTHPGYLPPIAPGSAAARPLRPTPYASAVIPPPAAYEASTEEVGADTDADSTAGYPADAANAAPRPADGMAASGAIQSLREVPGDHAHPSGVPANPEVAVEGVDAVSDYPTEALWSSEAVFGWGASEADWEVANSTSSHPRPARGSGDTPVSAPATEQTDLARGAADVLESLADALRRGDLRLPGVVWPQSPPAVLAAVLAALLTRTPDDSDDTDHRQGKEAREAPTAEPGQ